MSSLKPKPAGDHAAHATLAQGVAEAFAGARVAREPFRHWLFSGALTDALCRDLIRLPFPVAEFEDTYGKRDSHNDTRRFFSPPMQAQFAPMRAVAEAFQAASAVKSVEAMCGIALSGSYLRIEYCQDRNGFWLEPHMDIKEKHITIQIYLNDGPDAATLGTDMFDSEKRFHSRADGRMNEGMAFLPLEPGSWHGFVKRPIAYIRRSLIVNYVTADWRSRHELSFPEQPVA